MYKHFKSVRENTAFCSEEQKAWLIKHLKTKKIVASELVVDVQPKEITLAVLDNKKLVELQQESQSESYAVGNIYLGRVKKLMPALNAAFVDVGHKKDAFLH